MATTSIPPPEAAPFAFIGKPSKVIVGKAATTSIFTNPGTGFVLLDDRVMPDDVDPHDLITIQVQAPEFSIGHIPLREVDLWQPHDGGESVRVVLLDGKAICFYGCTVPRYATEVSEP